MSPSAQGYQATCLKYRHAKTLGFRLMDRVVVSGFCLGLWCWQVLAEAQNFHHKVVPGHDTFAVNASSFPIHLHLKTSGSSDDCEAERASLSATRSRLAQEANQVF